MASLFHSTAAICACLRVPRARKCTSQRQTQEREKNGAGDAPETWTTCGTTLRPCPPPLAPTLSRSTSAAQVVFAAVPRATRTMQRFVMGEKYLTVTITHQNRKNEKEF